MWTCGEHGWRATSPPQSRRIATWRDRRPAARGSARGDGRGLREAVAAGARFAHREDGPALDELRDVALDRARGDAEARRQIRRGEPARRERAEHLALARVEDGDPADGAAGR